MAAAQTEAGSAAGEFANMKEAVCNLQSSWEQIKDEVGGLGQKLSQDEGTQAASQQSCFLQFGLCGLDRSASPAVWQSALAQVGGEARKQLVLVAGVQLAYQGFPWAPTPDYQPDADPSKRRYEGRVYPAWHELQDLLPATVPVSFHLNETKDCPYVSGLLRGEANMQKLVSVLVSDFKACHIQVNLTAQGVPLDLLTAESQGVEELRKICGTHPEVVFIVPIADNGSVKTEPFVRALLRPPAPANVCAFFDNSAGTGKEPDAVPEIPSWYRQEIVGFTGGIHPGNVQSWLTKYAERAHGHGCRLISDVQSGIREDRKRGNPIDSRALVELSQSVRDWAWEQAAKL